MSPKAMAIGLVLVMGLMGCGAAGNFSSGMESSKTAYMRCLEQNPDNPERCAAFRQAYENDMRVFNTTTQGLTRRGVLSPD